MGELAAQLAAVDEEESLPSANICFLWFPSSVSD